MRDCCKWNNRFKTHGIRSTAAREAIMEVFTTTDKHISAEDIYMTVHAQNPAIGLTTVYRTLELLEQTGIITRFDFGHGRAKYELAEEFSSKDHHHHLICKKCRKIVDYTDFLTEEKHYLEKTEAELQKKYGFDIESHIIHFYGICPECKAD